MSSNLQQRQYPFILITNQQADNRIHLDAANIAPCGMLISRGILSMNANQLKEYLRFVANRRFQQIGIEILFPGAENPFPWMSELIDLKKEKISLKPR